MAMIEKICEVCKQVFSIKNYRKDTARFCSYICMGKSHRGKVGPFRGKKMSKEHRNKLRLAKLNNPVRYWSGKKRDIFWMKGEKHPNWILDRSIVLKNKSGRTSTEYKIWSKNVKQRDDWKCKINDENCAGEIVAHHILPYAKFPELRFVVSNGIALCKFHHPTKRSEEMQKSDFFSNLLMHNKT